MLLHDDYMMMHAFFILKRNGEVITKTKAEVFILSYSVPSLSQLTLSCSEGGGGGGGGCSAPPLRFLPITQRRKKIIQPNLVSFLKIYRNCLKVRVEYESLAVAMTTLSWKSA